MICQGICSLRNPKDKVSAALMSWFAAAWKLERKWPERWGHREVPPGDETGMDTLVVIG